MRRTLCSHELAEQRSQPRVMVPHGNEPRQSVEVSTSREGQTSFFRNYGLGAVDFINGGGPVLQESEAFSEKEDSLNQCEDGWKDGFADIPSTGRRGWCETWTQTDPRIRSEDR